MLSKRIKDLVRRIACSQKIRKEKVDDNDEDLEHSIDLNNNKFIGNI